MSKEDNNGLAYVSLVAENAGTLQQLADNLEKLKGLSPEDKLKVMGAQAYEAKVPGKPAGWLLQDVGKIDAELRFEIDTDAHVFGADEPKYMINVKKEEIWGIVINLFDTTINDISSHLRQAALDAQALLSDNPAKGNALSILPDTLLKAETVFTNASEPKRRLVNESNKEQMVEATHSAALIDAFNKEIWEVATFDRRGNANIAVDGERFANDLPERQRAGLRETAKLLERGAVPLRERGSKDASSSEQQR